MSGLQLNSALILAALAGEVERFDGRIAEGRIATTADDRNMGSQNLRSGQAALFPLQIALNRLKTISEKKHG